MTSIQVLVDETAVDTKAASLKQFRRRFLFSIIAVVLFILLVYAISPFAILGIRTTESVPGHLFLILKNKMPERDGYVAFTPPPNRYHNKYRFIKFLGGIPGDQVAQESRNFYINGKFIGYAKEKAMNGDFLELSGAGKIPEGKYFVRGTHPDSFDSRYKDIGLIDEKSIIGTAYRIF